MNASRLKEIVELLLRRESEHKIQDILSEVNTHLSSLVGTPQEETLQKNFAETLNRLQKSMGDMIATFEPAQITLFAEIGADKYFSSDIPGDIAQSVRDNPITPAVSRDYVGALLGERQTYLDEIDQLRANFEKLGIKVSELEEGTAEIGFLIPRELFQNQFDQFIKQLGVINRIIREFSEIATGSAQEIEVRQISTSDPLIFFGLDIVTIVQIGGAITWSLVTWKLVEEIRKIRAETSKIGAFTKDDLTFFEDKIKKTIEAETKKKVKELLGLTRPKSARTVAEQRNHITSALKTLLALVERGLKVEIRFLPSPPQEGAEEDQEATVQPEFAQLKEIVPQLVFPPVEGTPVLDLPPPEPEVEVEVESRKSVVKEGPKT